MSCVLYLLKYTIIQDCFIFRCDDVVIDRQIAKVLLHFLVNETHPEGGLLVRELLAITFWYLKALIHLTADKPYLLRAS